MRRIQAAMLLYAATLLPAFAQDAQQTNAPQAGTPGDNEVPLHDVVVTATRIPTDIEHIPAGVTVVDRDTMQTRDYNTLVDALSALPGLQVVQSGGAGQVASVFIRGTNSDHVVVLRDGMPVNDPSDPGGAFNFGVDMLDDIERIEVVRGPMSACMGRARSAA